MYTLVGYGSARVRRFGKGVSPVTGECFHGGMNIDAITTIRQEAERLASALTTTDPEQRVPTCPDWTADDLLWHLTEVHEFWAAILSTGATTVEEVTAIDERKTDRPEGREALLGRRVAATESLLAQLEARADEEMAWFWFSEHQSVAIVRRMQTHEAIIHRVDAELTAGQRVSAIDSRTAAAGLDHVLEVMWPAAYEWIPDWARTTTPATVAEIRPQGGSARLLGISRWRGTRPRDGQEFDVPVARLLSSPGEAEGLPRASASGSAIALNLWAWGREQALEHLAAGSQKVHIHGDPAAITELEALITEGHD